MSADIGRTEFLELVPTLTVRQLDHWTRQGWLNAEMRPRRDGGRGERFWPFQEAVVARVMLRLTRAGMAAEVAAPIGRAIAEDVWLGENPVTVRIGPKLSLVIDFDNEESGPEGSSSSGEVDTLLSRL